MKRLGPYDGTSVKPSAAKINSKEDQDQDSLESPETFEELDDSLIELDSIEDGILEDFGETEIETTTGKNSESESEEK